MKSYLASSYGLGQVSKALGTNIGGYQLGAWTDWRKIADYGNWYDELLDWDGPAVYELAIGGPRGGDLEIGYVGETSNEKQRIVAYASHGSHLSKIIDSHLKDDRHLYYRAQAKKSKEEAVLMQNRLLSGYDYAWNIQLNS